METGLVKRPRHILVLPAVIGGTGTGDEKDQRCRTFLRCVGVAHFRFVPQKIRHLAIREYRQAAIPDRDLLGQIRHKLRRCTNDRGDVLVVNRVPVGLPGGDPTRHQPEGNQ